MTSTKFRAQAVFRITLLIAAGWGLLGCGVVNTLNRPTETPTAVPSAIIEIVSERSLNPDIDGMPKPVLLRIYELRAPAAFERSSFFDLQDKDESQLGGDFVRREEFLITPGERRTGRTSIRSSRASRGSRLAYSSKPAFTQEGMRWPTAITIIRMTAAAHDLTRSA